MAFFIGPLFKLGYHQMKAFMAEEKRQTTATTMTKNQFKAAFERRIANLSLENRIRVIKEATDDATILSYMSPAQLELLQAIFEKDEEEKNPVTIAKDQKIERLVKLDPIVEAVRAKLHQRSQVGIEKYKTTLADSNLTERQILIHAQEEALDLANYLEYRIQQLDKNTACNSSPL